MSQYNIMFSIFGELVIEADTAAEAYEQAEEFSIGTLIDLATDLTISIDEPRKSHEI